MQVRCTFAVAVAVVAAAAVEVVAAVVMVAVVAEVIAVVVAAVVDKHSLGCLGQVGMFPVRQWEQWID